MYAVEAATSPSCEWAPETSKKSMEAKMKSSMRSKENQLPDEGILGLIIRALSKRNSLPWDVVRSLSLEIFKLRVTDRLVAMLW